jgi:hypothetical protein
MRKLLACGLAAFMAWGLGIAVARAGDEDTEDTDAKPAPRPIIRLSPVFAHMVHVDTPSPPEQKPEAKTEKPAKAKDAEARKPSKLESQTAKARSREEAALIRRLEVCDKLMEVAIRTNDRDLENRAYELDARARAVYTRNTALLSDRRAATGSDERSAEKRQDSASAPKKPASQGQTAKNTRGDEASQPSVGEVNP